ncbi:MAG: MFS transporter, partial [Acidimicrobiales bacterium]
MPAATDRRLPRELRWSVVALLGSVFAIAAAGMAQVTVLGKLVYDLTGSELDLGLLGLAEFAPAALLVLVAGPVADRYPRRRLVAAAVTGEALVALGLAAYSRSSSVSVGVILALVVAYGVCQAFVAPALRSLPMDMVDPVHVPRLIARRSTAWQAAIIAGPVMG